MCSGRGDLDRASLSKPGRIPRLLQIYSRRTFPARIARHEPEPPSETTGLVTGASGFIGLHCVRELLQDGYRVRGTVRSLTREPALRDALGQHASAKTTSSSQLAAIRYVCSAPRRKPASSGSCSRRRLPPFARGILATRRASSTRTTGRASMGTCRRTTRVRPWPSTEQYAHLGKRAQLRIVVDLESPPLPSHPR